MKLSKEERETIIRFDESNEPVSVFTYNKPLIRRLAQFTKDHPDCAKLLRTYPEGSVEYEVVKERVSLRFTAPYSEERRKEMSEYAKMHSKIYG